MFPFLIKEQLMFVMVNMGLHYTGTHIKFEDLAIVLCVKQHSSYSIQQYLPDSLINQDQIII